MLVAPIIRIVIPDFQTIVHEIGCIPHSASIVNTAPVRTRSKAVIPNKNLIVVNFKVQKYFQIYEKYSVYRFE